MRPFALAASSLLALAAFAPPAPARAADLPPELAGLVEEGKKWYDAAGNTDASTSERNEARKKAWVNLYQAYEILDRFTDEHPESAGKAEGMLEKVTQMKHWIKKESPVGLLESTGVGPKHDAPAKPSGWPDKPPPEKPGNVPGGDPPPSGNPFDKPGAKPAEPGPAAPPPARTIELAFKETEEYARKHRADAAGVMQAWQEFLAAFAEQTGHALFLEAARRAGDANTKLKDFYRKSRDDDPDSLKNVDSAEVVRMLLVLGRDLGSQDSGTRERSAKLMALIGSGEGVYPLVKAMKKETEAQALLAEGNAVVAIGGRKAVAELGKLQDDAKLGTKAYEMLTKLTEKNPVDRRLAIKEIGGFALAKDESLAAKAVDFLVGLGAEGAFGLVEALNTNNLETRIKVITALGQTKNPQVARPLSNFLIGGDNPNTVKCKTAAMDAIKSLGEPAVPYLFPALRNPTLKIQTGYLLFLITGERYSAGRPGDWVAWWKSKHPEWKEGE